MLRPECARHEDFDEYVREALAGKRSQARLKTCRSGKTRQISAAVPQRQRHHYEAAFSCALGHM